MATKALNPDCRDGKHQACRGDGGWDVEADIPVPCGCECHEGTNVAEMPDSTLDRAA